MIRHQTIFECSFFVEGRDFDETKEAVEPVVETLRTLSKQFIERRPVYSIKLQ